MARLLLLTDFSDDPLHAARYAARLLGTEGHTIRVLHVWSDAGLAGPMTPSYAPLVDIWQEDLDGSAKQVGQLTGIPVEGQDLLYGTLPPVMDAVVQRYAIDLVVMGRRGKGASLLFGSSAVDVMRSGHAPTLIVPSGAPLAPPARIALADDHRPVAPEDLALLRRIAWANHSRVMVLHVDRTPDDEAAHKASGAYTVGLQGVPHSYRNVVGEDIAEALEVELGRTSADMLVMVHRHLGVLHRLLEPSITKGMVLQGELPLLVLHR